MSVSLTKTYAPGTVVRIVGTNDSEDGIIGYVARTRPTNGDEVLVGIISAPKFPWATKGGTRLSYRWENLAPQAQ